MGKKRTKIDPERHQGDHYAGRHEGRQHKDCPVCLDAIADGPVGAAEPEGTEGQDRDGYSDATELDHLRAACRAIIRVCHGHTPGDPVEDLAQCANLAGQGLKGEPLVGDPGVYDIKDIDDL